MIPTLSSRPMAAHACPISPQRRAVHLKFWFRSLLLLETGLEEQPPASSCAHQSGPNTQEVASFLLQEL